MNSWYCSAGVRKSIQRHCLTFSLSPMTHLLINTGKCGIHVTLKGFQTMLSRCVMCSTFHKIVISRVNVSILVFICVCLVYALQDCALSELKSNCTFSISFVFSSFFSSWIKEQKYSYNRPFRFSQSVTFAHSANYHKINLQLCGITEYLRGLSMCWGFKCFHVWTQS